jgi:hypothetical protein
MTKGKPPIGPEFTNFIAAARGPAEVEFHAARFSVESLILYDDGVRLDWLMKPMPDLSWLPSEQDEARRLAADIDAEPQASSSTTPSLSANTRARTTPSSESTHAHTCTMS